MVVLPGLALPYTPGNFYLTFGRARCTDLDVVARQVTSPSSATTGRLRSAPPPEATLIDPRLGTRLQGRYWIRSQLATGAMGTVYRGERLSVGRPVAIKFLNPAVAAQDVFVEQFRNEV